MQKIQKAAHSHNCGKHNNNNNNKNNNNNNNKFFTNSWSKWNFEWKKFSYSREKSPYLRLQIASLQKKKLGKPQYNNSL